MFDSIGTIFWKLLAALFLMGVVGVLLMLTLPTLVPLGVSESQVNLLGLGIDAVILVVVLMWKPKVAETGAKPTCFGCGYDLTGNESGTCPECGQSIETPQPDDRTAL